LDRNEFYETDHNKLKENAMLYYNNIAKVHFQNLIAQLMSLIDTGQKGPGLGRQAADLIGLSFGVPLPFKIEQIQTLDTYSEVFLCPLKFKYGKTEGSCTGDFLRAISNPFFKVICII
jgi:hypothetical protein